MGHHVLIQLLYCFLDLLVGHLLLLFAISIGRSIILILALRIFNNCGGLVKFICCFYIGRIVF